MKTVLSFEKYPVSYQLIFQHHVHVSLSLYAQIIIRFSLSKKVDNFTTEKINVTETKKKGYYQEGNTPYLLNQLRPAEETRRCNQEVRRFESRPGNPRF